MTKRLESPLSTREKALLRRIVGDLQLRGTYEQIPAELLLDYVHLDTRISDLQKMAQEFEDPKLKLGTYRQLEAAVTQRRGLANLLFPQPEVGKKVLKHLAANAAGNVDDDWAKLLPT